MLGYTHVDQHGLRESGAGDAGLVVNGGKYEALTGTGGLEASWNLGTIRPYANLAVAYDLHREGFASRSQMIGGIGHFLVQSAVPGRTAGVGSVGLSASTGPLDLNAGYNVEVREDFHSHSVSAGLTVRW